MIQVGYFPCQQDPPSAQHIDRLWKEVIVEAGAAERAGFDSCLFSEHHQQPDGYLPNPLMLAGLVGAATQRIRVGTCVLLLPLYHPVHVAEDVAVIDVATGGRLILGVGVGYQQPDFDAFGVPFAARIGRCEEGIEILHRAWTGERFSFEGRHFQIGSVQVTPRPLQQPRPPIWMAAWTPPGLRRAARIADAWLTDPLQSLPVIQRFAGIYRKEAEKLGRPSSVALMRDVWVAPTRSGAQAESDPIMYTHRFYFRYGAYAADDPYLQGVRSEGEWTFERAVKDRFVIGTPEECRDEIRRWCAEIRPDYLILRMRHPGGPPHARVVEAIRLFGDKVLPHL
jgi:probable F420-dependent oxidoreductase